MTSLSPRKRLSRALVTVALSLLCLACGSSPEPAESVEDDELSTLRADADAEADEASGRGEAWSQEEDDHSGHDHSAHDHSGHDHSAHDHSAHGAAKPSAKESSCECCETKEGDSPKKQ